MNCWASRSAAGEDQVFWEEFLTSLNERGLRGVKLVISDAHAAIASAVQKLLPDAAWQACRIHFGRNIARRVRPGQRQLALAAYSAIYVQPDRERAKSACHAFAEAMERLDPRLGDYVDDREVELTAFADFPPAHWRKIWSTNPLERLMAEIKRRTRVVQLSPTTPRSSGWWGRSCVSRTTNGSAPSAATCRGSRWP